MSLTSYQNASISALSVLYAAVDANARSGGYYGPENDTKGYPMEARPNDAVFNETDAKRL